MASCVFIMCIMMFFVFGMRTFLTFSRKLAETWTRLTENTFLFPFGPELSSGSGNLKKFLHRINATPVV